MTSGENIHNAFAVVFKTLQSIEKLMSKCRTELDQNRYYMPAERFMRHHSDLTWEGWIYWSFILLFQRYEDGAVMDNGWIKFNLDDEDAYVSGEFVNVEERLEKAVTITELQYGQGVSDVKVDLVQYAKQFIGNPYVWGGVSLTNGADCSGFTMSIYKKYGVSLPHHAASQAQIGKSVSLSEIQPGDLVF